MTLGRYRSLRESRHVGESSAAFFDDAVSENYTRCHIFKLQHLGMWSQQSVAAGIVAADRNGLST